MQCSTLAETIHVWIQVARKGTLLILQCWVIAESFGRALIQLHETVPTRWWLIKRQNREIYQRRTKIYGVHMWQPLHNFDNLGSHKIKITEMARWGAISAYVEVALDTTIFK